MSDLKPPLVLIPGAMAGAASWIYQLEEFSKDRSVTVPERHLRLPTIGRMAEEIAQELPSECDLVGWSMGGYIALELYCLAASRVRRLILLSTSARPESEEAYRTRMALIETAQTEGLSSMWDQLFASAFAYPERIPAELKDRLRADYLALGADTFRSQAEAMAKRRDMRPMLSSIRCPTLVLVGKRDTTTPVECSVELASMVQRGTLKVIQGAGHNSPLEVPAVVNKHFRGLLDH